jgi:ABC superfamily ATP binding cassette transporter, ABC protein
MRYARNLMANLRQAVDDYTDHVVAMQHDRIRRSGATNEVLTADNISALYNMEVEMLSHGERRVCLYF